MATRFEARTRARRLALLAGFFDTHTRTMDPYISGVAFHSHDDSFFQMFETNV